MIVLLSLSFVGEGRSPPPNAGANCEYFGGPCARWGHGMFDFSPSIRLTATQYPRQDKRALTRGKASLSGPARCYSWPPALVGWGRQGVWLPHWDVHGVRGGMCPDPPRVDQVSPAGSMMPPTEVDTEVS